MIKIKNNDSQSHTWCGQEIQASEYYEIQAQERTRWANDSDVLVALANAVALMNNGESDITDVNSAVEFLKGLDVKIQDGAVVTPTAVKNEYSSEPFGCDKGYIVSSEQACPITLSNKSQDGLTFTYNSEIPKTVSIGNYVFQDHFQKRSWIVEVDTENHTVTFESPNLDDGVGHYVIGKYIDSIVRDWKAPNSQYPYEYIWGVMLSAISATPIGSDFCELAIIDRNDLFLNDQFCRAVFGVDADDPMVEAALLQSEFEWSEEYGGHWTKYYDESWVENANGKQIKSPDGAPGELLPGLFLRISYFTTKQDSTVTDVFVDYLLTSRS